MKQIVCAIVIAFGSPALAQGDVLGPPDLPEMVVPEPLLPDPVFPEEKPPKGEGVDLMEEGAKLLFRGLMGELQPMFDDMGKALEDMQPALRKLIALVDDIRNYDAPRILDNGDILIPRRKGAPPPLSLPPKTAPGPTPAVPVLPGPDGEIEL